MAYTCVIIIFDIPHDIIRRKADLDRCISNSLTVLAWNNLWIDIYGVALKRIVRQGPIKGLWAFFVSRWLNGLEKGLKFCEHAHKIRSLHTHGYVDVKGLDFVSMLTTKKTILFTALLYTIPFRYIIASHFCVQNYDGISFRFESLWGWQWQPQRIRRWCFFVMSSHGLQCDGLWEKKSNKEMGKERRCKKDVMEWGPRVQEEWYLWADSTNVLEVILLNGWNFEANCG